MKFISLFSGIGGFDLGFEQAGMECLTQVEIDKYCIGVLNKHWPTVIKHEDVKNVGRKQLSSADVVCGGFPCQGLSVAGQRGGLADPRSGLWYEFARIIQEIRSKWIVIENVPGLLSSNGRRDFAIILESLDEWGYGVAWRRLDSQFYGLAQRRQRIFFVGCHGDLRSAAKVLFESESLSWNTAPSREKRKENPKGIGEGTLDLGRTADRIRINPDVSATLQSEEGGMGAKTGLYAIPEISNSIPTKNRLGLGTDLETIIVQPVIGFNLASDPTILEEQVPTITNRHGDSNCVAFQQNTRDEVRKIGGSGQITGALGSELGAKQQNYLYQWASGGGDDLKDTAQALRSTAEHNYQFAKTKFGIRRLMPIECERLQGFPDYWTKGHSDTQRYKMLGNAVSVSVAYWIGNRIMKLNEQTKNG